MLDYARQRVIDALRVPRSAVLATSGPAGVQAGEFRCEADGLDLYLLLPRTSDHLFNLEQQPGVTLLTAGWELKGEARVLPPGAPCHDLELLKELGAGAAWSEWYALVRVAPHQLSIRREAAQPRWGNVETIDLQPD